MDSRQFYSREADLSPGLTERGQSTGAPAKLRALPCRYPLNPYRTCDCEDPEGHVGWSKGSTDLRSMKGAEPTTAHALRSLSAQLRGHHRCLIPPLVCGNGRLPRCPMSTALCRWRVSARRSTVCCRRRSKDGASAC